MHESGTLYVPFKELSEAAHCSAPSPCRSPQPAARSWPCLAWRGARMVRGTGRAWHRTDQAIRGFRGPLRSHPIFDLLQNIKPPFILPASRVTRLAASLQSLPPCLTPHCIGILSKPNPTAPWTGFDTQPPPPPTLLCRNARRRHGSRACPTLTLAPCSHRTAETNLENRPSSQHHTIAPSHYRIIASFASIAPLCAASREREGHKHLFDSSFPILEIRRGPHPREHVRPSVLGFPCAFYSMRSGSMRCVVPETMSLGHAIHPTTQLSPWGCCPRTHSQQPKTSRCRVAPVRFPLTRLCPGRGTPAVVSTAIVDYPGRLAKGLPSASAATAARSIPTPTAAAPPRIPGATHPAFRPAGMASATPCPESSLRAAPRR